MTDDVIDDLTRYDDLLPEGAVPLYGLRLVCFVDSEGVTQHDWCSDGDVRLGEMVGAIEVAKMQMWRNTEDEEDD